MGIEKKFLKPKKEQKQKTMFSLLSNFTLKSDKTLILQYKKPYNIIAKLPKNASFSIVLECWDEVGKSLEV